MALEQLDGRSKDRGAPSENFSRGLLTVEIPELGPKIQGKVRDMWVVGDERVIVTTDRQSAFDRVVATVPDKGAVLNLTSAFWFAKTELFAPNHLISVPHPNVMIVKEAEKVIPVEVVWRDYMARSSTTTSIYHNYVNLGRRVIYGIPFREGFKPNERFDKSILTPTTKSASGHDLELTDDEAREIADEVGGAGTWDRIRIMTESLFAYGSRIFVQKGLIFVDTKYEIGIDKNGNLMVIDEVHTPDSSRIWKANTYQERFESGKDPETFDKEILRRWLASKGFIGEGDVPKIDSAIIDEMSAAYGVPYRRLTGDNVLRDGVDPNEIREAILASL